MISGVGRTQIDLVLAMPFMLIAGVVWWLSWSGKPSLAMLAAGMAVVFGVAYFKGAAFPELDDRVSVRGFWRAHGGETTGACLEGVGRTWEYGLNYYAGRPFHACLEEETPKIVVLDGRLTVVRSGTTGRGRPTLRKACATGSSQPGSSSGRVERLVDTPGVRCPVQGRIRGPLVLPVNHPDGQSCRRQAAASILRVRSRAVSEGETTSTASSGEP